MRKYDDDREDERDDEPGDSQVRNIIKKLNEDAPGKEKSREVIVRADGTKVVRVVKKKRVMVSRSEKRRRSLRSGILCLIILLVLGVAFGSYFAYRMSTFDAKLIQTGEALKEAWGAESVTCSGISTDGNEFSIEQIEATFPQGHLLRKVVLSKLKGSLSARSYILGKPCSDEINIGRADISVNGDLDAMQMPLLSGEELWDIKRVNCGAVNLSILKTDNQSDSGQTEIIGVEQAGAYLYYPRNNRTICSVILKGGNLKLRGMQSRQLDEATCLLSPDGIESFNIRSANPGQQDQYLSLRGELRNGAKLAGPYKVEAQGIPFETFTAARFENIFKAQVTLARNQGNSRIQVELPFNHTRPVFSGQFDLYDITLKGLPALSTLCKHQRTDWQNDYRVINLPDGTVTLQNKDGNLTLIARDGDMREQGKINLRFDLRLDTRNQLDGTIGYGIPESRANREYEDGLPDPVYEQQAPWCWLNTKVSGSINAPTDNSRQLDDAADPQRINRKRVNYNDHLIDGLLQNPGLLDDTRIPPSSGSSTPSSNTPSTPAPAAPTPSTPGTPAIPADLSPGDWNHPAWDSGSSTGSDNPFNS